RKGWGRYLEAGPEGLDDLTRANHHVAQRIPPELERAILSVRRRLQAHATPATRYCLIGATAILAEPKGLGVRPLPCERTVERVLERNNVTAPRVRLAPPAAAPGVPRAGGPGPQTPPRGSFGGGDSPPGGVAPATTSGWARTPSTAPSACAWPSPAAWTKSCGSSASAGRTSASP